jgi:valyl-tRNA synthetase
LAEDYSLSLDDLLRMSPDFKAYHPTSVMETGWDILFFWVARMILATTYATGQIPFKTVYLHGLVRAESGRKMSKSDPETIIDPLEVIPEYGTDALRLALVSGVNAGQDQRLGRSKIVDNRNFCNKLWNIARYIEGAAGEAAAKAEPKSIADHWILNKLSILTEAVNKDLSNFKFSAAYQEIYHFVWDDLADWYIEASKSELNPGLLKYVLESTLIIAHPFVPFITEAIWQNMELKKGHLLASQLLPIAPKADVKEASKFEGIKQLISEVRALTALTGTRPSKLFYKDVDWLEDQDKLFGKLAHLNQLDKVSEEPKGSMTLTSVEGNFWVDINPKIARPKIEDLIKQYEHSAHLLNERLNQPGYRDKAPKELVTQSEKELEENTVLAGTLKRILSSIN